MNRTPLKAKLNKLLLTRSFVDLSQSAHVQAEILTQVGKENVINTTFSFNIYKNKNNLLYQNEIYV